MAPVSADTVNVFVAGIRRPVMASGWAQYHKNREAETVDDFTLSEGLTEALEQKLAVFEQKQVAFKAWAQKVPEPKTGTLDWKRFPFQPELYEAAAHREVVVKKATQVGVSAFLVRWTMFWADRGLIALYVFPKQKQMYDFSDSRIRPLILGSEYLRERVPPLHVQNKGLKQLGLGFIYYRGSESVDQLDSVDADVLALDEYDTLDQSNIPDAERRISGSEYRYLRRVGVPTIPEYGIARLYDESDRRRWTVKCDRCNEWQQITFKDNIDLEQEIRVCSKCRKPLNVADGEWVPERPDVDVRGYHISRLIVPNVDLAQIIKASKATEPYKRQVFYNKDLGEEYAPEEGRLSPQAIAAAQRDYFAHTRDQGYQGDNLVTMGVDVADSRPLTVRISEHVSETRKRALFIGEVDNFDELALLMERFNVNMCCIDHLPSGRLAMAFAERFAGRVYLIFYRTSNIPGDVLSPPDDEQHRVGVKRVEAIDATMEQIRQQRNELPQNLPENYVAEMQANVRMTEKDEVGKVTVVYRNTSADDYLHAEVYDLVATEVWWVRQMAGNYSREEFQPLDQLMEFQRSDLNDEEAMDYRPGPDDGEYSTGF